MRNSTKAIIAGIVVIGTMGYMGVLYNTVVPKQEHIERTVANEQIELKRRADLLPNIATTVGSAAKFERSTYTDVAAARAAQQGVSRLDPTKIANDPALQRQVIDAQAKMGAALAKVNAAVESNPELKATDQFRDLTHNITESEERVAYARREEQSAFVSYNTYVRHVPRHWFLAVMGFHAMPYYNAGAGAQDAPVLTIPQ